IYPGSSVESCHVTKRSHHSSSGQARRALSSMSIAAPNCCQMIVLQVMIFMLHLLFFHTREPARMSGSWSSWKRWSLLHAQRVDYSFELLDVRSFMVCQPLGICIHGPFAWLSRPRHR